jgi:hypothetical protein
MRHQFMPFVGGLVLGAVLVAGAWRLDHGCGIIGKLHSTPQSTFDSTQWKQSNAQVRAGMITDLQKLLQKTRPSRDEAEKILGPADYVVDSGFVSDGRGLCWVYRIDLGQRFSGLPFHDKFGLIFDKDGHFQSISIWD